MEYYPNINNIFLTKILCIVFLNIYLNFIGGNFCSKLLKILMIYLDYLIFFLLFYVGKNSNHTFRLFNFFYCFYTGEIIKY